MAKFFASFRTSADTYLKHKVSIDATWQPTDYEASLIKKTWSEDFDDLYSLGSTIYTYIFENNPNVKDLFPNIHKYGENWKESKEFGAQSLKFAQTLSSVVENIYRIDHVKQLLFQIGAKHVAFAKRGFHPDYWDVFEEAMALSMVERIHASKEWDEDQKIDAIEAWKKLARFIIENFKIGYSWRGHSTS
uniref:Globin family profile domain-containing protein n=1 Tax=Acrobeloides nanus TaxID=290746 RepID=A0A914DU13_9BILA